MPRKAGVKYCNTCYTAMDKGVCPNKDNHAAFLAMRDRNVKAAGLLRRGRPAHNKKNNKK